MQNKTRSKFKTVIAVVMLVCFIAVSALSMAFVIVHEHHDCIGEGCEICFQLCLAEQTLKQKIQIVIFTMPLFLAIFIVAFVFYQATICCCGSLFTQKVKLNI